MKWKSILIICLVCIGCVQKTENKIKALDENIDISIPNESAKDSLIGNDDERLHKKAVYNIFSHNGRKYKMKNDYSDVRILKSPFLFEIKWLNDYKHSKKAIVPRLSKESLIQYAFYTRS